jgi:hypothetical protein
VTGRIIVGVDPGGRMTGIAARSGDIYLGHELVIRHGRSPIPGRAYLREVCERVEAWRSAWPATRVVVAIEGVRERSRRVRRDDPGEGLIALGKVLGALELWFPDAVSVAPDRHGHNLLAAYPDPLVGADERARLTGDGPLVHCRAAWDVAGRARLLLQAARRAGPVAAGPQVAAGGDGR